MQGIPAKPIIYIFKKKIMTQYFQKGLFFVALLTNLHTSYSQQLVPAQKDNLWGYIDYSKKIIIKPAFATAAFFNNGLAAVRKTKDGKAGYIDAKGKQVIPFLYNEAANFAYGVASVKKEPMGLYELINKAGKPFANISSIQPFVFKYGLSPVFALNKNGPPIISKDEFGNETKDYRNCATLKGYVDTLGKMVISGDQMLSGLALGDYAFFDGLAISSKAGKYGFIDTKGNFVVQPDYEIVKPFANELAAVKKPQDYWGFINTKGERAVRPEYTEVRPFKEGRAAVKTGGKWGMINSGNRFVINPAYKSLSDKMGIYTAAAEIGDSKFTMICQVITAKRY